MKIVVIFLNQLMENNDFVHHYRLKRSSCENNYNQRLKRNKEKALSLVELGNSIEEISQIINESPETIQQWIINKVN